MESKLPDNFRIEETPTIEGTEKKEVPPPKTIETYDQVGLGIMIGELRSEIAALNTKIATMTETDIPKPAVEETTEETSPETEPTPEPSPPKAKTAVPQGAASKKDDLDEDGVFRIDVG